MSIVEINYMHDRVSFGMCRKNICIAAYAFSAIILGLYHIYIGSSLLISILFTSISITGAAFLVASHLTYSNLFIFLLSIYSGYASLIIKAVLRQPLQQNLFAVEASLFYMFVGFYSITACAIFSKIIVAGRRSRMRQRVEVDSFCNRAIIPLIFLGFLFRLLHLAFAAAIKDGADIASGFGGFGAFNFVLTLACIILFRIYSKRGEFKHGVLIFAIGLIIIVLSVITNTKKDILDFILLALLCIYAFEINIKFRTLVPIALAVCIVVLYVSPVIHLMRSNLNNMSILERLHGMYEIIQTHEFNPINLMETEATYFEGFQYSYSEYGSYVYPSPANVDRFALILPVDQVSRALEANGVIGFWPFIEEIAESALPSLIISKDPEVGSDLVAWYYGIRSPSSIARPVVGFVASSLASSGIVGVILFPWIFLLPALIFMDYFFGGVKGSIWGVFGFVSFYHFAEKEIDRVLPIIVREGPIIIISAFVLTAIFTRRFRAHGSRNDIRS